MRQTGELRGCLCLMPLEYPVYARCCWGAPAAAACSLTLACQVTLQRPLYSLVIKAGFRPATGSFSCQSLAKLHAAWLLLRVCHSSHQPCTAEVQAPKRSLTCLMSADIYLVVPAAAARACSLTDLAAYATIINSSIKTRASLP